ncbi:MAG: inositol monophosphatase [Limnochordia bacterium]|nr:inositol monophosphatase [Limnochordia bacterium]
MYVDIMATIAKQAGNLLLEMRKRGFRVAEKSGLDLVTDADKASEELIIRALQQHYPDYNIMAEEQGWFKKVESEFTWVIDPLDGTANYVHGFPHYSVSIGLLRDDKPLAGVVYNPVLQELFSAEQGQGSFLNGELIRVSDATRVQGGLFATGFSGDSAKVSEESMAQFHTITKESHGVRRIGSGALDLCYVACGYLDGYWEKPINAWDIAAGAIILSEAGGTVSGIRGQTVDLFSGEIAGTNGLLHDELIRLLQTKK